MREGRAFVLESHKAGQDGPQASRLGSPTSRAVRSPSRLGGQTPDVASAASQLARETASRAFRLSQLARKRQWRVLQACRQASHTAASVPMACLLAAKTKASVALPCRLVRPTKTGVLAASRLGQQADPGVRAAGRLAGVPRNRGYGAFPIGTSRGPGGAATRKHPVGPICEVGSGVQTRGRRNTMEAIRSEVGALGWTPTKQRRWTRQDVDGAQKDSSQLPGAA